MPYGNTRPVRIRERIDMRPWTSNYRPVSGPSSNSTQNWWRHYSWMLDQNNRANKGSRRPPGVCQHLKVDSVYENPVYTVKLSSSDPGYSVVNWLSENYAGGNGQSPAGSPATRPNDHGFSNLVGPFQSTSTYENLCVQAFSKQITQVPAKISLYNFLYELKDFKELGKSLSKIPKLLKDQSLARHVNLVTKHKKSLPKVVAKSGVDTFLSYNFQWAPFVGDLQTLTKVGENAYKRLDFLRKTNKKDVTVHFSKDDCYTHPSVGQDVLTITFGASKHHYVLRSYECKFTSTWRLYHDLGELDDALSGLRAVYATLGLSNPAKALWNAIPFSFMLDWVGPIGSWLEKAASQPFSGEWVISEVTSSVHEVYYIDFVVENYYGPVTMNLMQTVVIDRYTRLDGLPFTLGAVDFSQLTDTQQKLALAIPLSKVLK